ncbi:hypothetical protein GWI33_007812 [Rhynchophorus ferrugineus]|uniref:N-acylneuraminate cytidylyltransferase n=1 Tax=Rhynchophorus ferrugineus TaxID=354439 RepID=A0A834IJB7_RHYFE|nr:hypothetical protein GWI33_007812 [Rhynchophorus ferrugineus]
MKIYVIYYALVIFILFDEIFACKKIKRYIFNKRPHVAALILARGGSKGIKLKNIQKVGGISLLGRSLKQINQVNFDSVWVSTEHNLIYKEAIKFNSNIHWRSVDTATDEATSLFAVQEFLKHHSEVDVVFLVQCTSPFLHKSYLNEALTLLENYKCVFSVSRSTKLRWISQNKLIALNFDPYNRPRRQDMNTEFIENGMFYVASRHLIQTGIFQNNKSEVNIKYNQNQDFPYCFVVKNENTPTRIKCCNYPILFRFSAISITKLWNRGNTSVRRCRS